jgi:tetratricopeptide (TPR) repeat protein
LRAPTKFPGSYAPRRALKGSDRFRRGGGPPERTAGRNQGNLEAAEREILTALRLDPEWELAQTNLAVVLVRQRRFEQAGEARAKLGSLLLKHRKYRAVAELFQKEVDARPRDPAAHNNLGVALVAAARQPR